jgi:hypothetical protein
VYQARDAVYTNWFTPFLWCQIEAAVKDPINVGRGMSSWKIQKVLQKNSPQSFGRIRHTTIEGWIDRTGVNPRWKDTTLERAERGNHQRHDKGGQRGVLVSSTILPKNTSSSVHTG